MMELGILEHMALSYLHSQTIYQLIQSSYPKLH